MKRLLLPAMLAWSVAVPAAPFTVTNLNDSGAGSLRDAIVQSNATPGSNSITFAAGLTGTIVLTSGELIVTQGPLTISGPGAGVLAIDGNATDRILSVEDSGTISCPMLTSPTDYLFTMSGLTLKNGNRTASNSGGAIASRKSMTLQNMVIDANDARVGGGAGFLTQYVNQTLTIDGSQFTNNLARPLSAVSATGGGLFVGPLCAGVFTQTLVSISNSVFRDNQVTPVDLQQGYAGGVYLSMRGTATISRTRITGNRVILPTTLGAFSYGGGGLGADVTNLTVVDSEISLNQANSGAGIEFFNVDTGRQGAADRTNFMLANSTVSGNTAYVTGGGVQIVGNVNADLRNLTISANSAQATRTGGVRYTTNSGLSPPTTSLISTIIAGNAAGTLSIGVNTSFITAPFTIPMSNSLIRRPDVAGNLAFSGAGNLIGADASLAPLAFNGGPTQTHALLPASLAIDSGSNPLNLTTDERGAGFPRVLGVAADMGAYEYPASCAGFTDSTASAFCANIEWMRNRVVTGGCATGLYCPALDVIREPMAAFLNRVGKTLTPETLFEQDDTGGFALPGEPPAPAVRRCITPAATAHNYPRQALVTATMSGLADGNSASWRAALVISYDGVNWDNFAPGVSVGLRTTSAPNAWSDVMVVETIDLAPGVAPLFAINMRRDNQIVSTGDLAAGRCQIDVVISNRNPAAPPF